MNNLDLGKKLKEARLSKKMTQSDVVGTFITRNMLSQIESGAASPSLRTLEYLANVLELPIHYLVAENIEDIEHIEKSALANQDMQISHTSKEIERITNPELYGLVLSLKALYDAGQYDKLGEILEELLKMAQIKN